VPAATPDRTASPAAARAEAACSELRALRAAEQQRRSAFDATRARSGHAEAAAERGDACSGVDDAVERLLQGDALGPRDTLAPSSAHSWDGTSPPRYLDRVDARFGLSAQDRATLRANRFVVADRLRAPSYGEAMQEILESNLPIYISADALLEAIHAGHEELVVALERTRLEPALRTLLDALACALPGAAPTWPADVGRDVTLYVEVAATLLRERAVPHDDRGASDGGDRSVVGLSEERGAPNGDDIDALSRAIADALTNGTPIPAGPASAVLERARAIDASALRLHGHYSGRTPELAGYFRATAWLSKLELHLEPGRACETPSGDRVAPDLASAADGARREILDAFALADLVARAGAGSDLEALDAAWSLLSARRPDVSMAELTRLRADAGIRSLSEPLAASKLRAALERARTPAPTDTSSEGCGAPPVATMLAPRVEPPAAPTTPLVAPAVPERALVHAVDIAYVLGQDRAKTYLARDLARWPELDAGLDRAREQAAMAPAGEGLYGAWLEAVRGLAESPSPSAPSFMRTNAWRDLRLNTTLAALAQLRDDAGPQTPTPRTDDAQGFSVPDAWVEPTPAMLDAILTYATRGSRAMATLDPDDTTGLGAYFEGLMRVVGALRAVAWRELSGEPLGDDERRFLATIAGAGPAKPGCDGGGCAPGGCSGWWFDLFVDRAGARADPRLISEYFVPADAGGAGYVGVGEPRLGIFVVDTNGPARAMVGPVATAYERIGTVDGRPADPASTGADAVDAPWSTTYTARAPPGP